MHVVSYLLAFFLCTGAVVGFAMDFGKTDELLGIVKTIIDVETTMLLEQADDLYIVSIGRTAIREETTRGILSARPGRHHGRTDPAVLKNTRLIPQARIICLVK